MARWHPVCAATLTAVAFAASLPASRTTADAELERLLTGLPWRSIGPAIMGGRINDVAVPEGRPNTLYLATASGGLFKTSNHGTSWESLFDAQPTTSIGDVAVAPSNPEVVWVGTGEANNRQSSSWGCGVYRSTDGGRTWKHLGLEGTMHIARIVADPRSADTAYVAAPGRLWGPSRERGLYKTTDGGATWQQVLFVDEDTGATDVVLDPSDPDTVIAATYQRRRTAYGFNGGGPGSGIHKSTDGGRTWRRIRAGLPAGDTGRIGLDICRSRPRIVYAVVEHAQGGVFRSEDGGETWTRMSSTNPRPMYYSQIRIDPNDDKRIWVLGVQVHISTDGGRTFSALAASRIHSDHHALWIDPADSSHLALGGDGGIHWTWDGGRTWDFVNTLPLAQFYEVFYDMRQPYWVYGGLQDNGSWAGPSATLTVRGGSNDEWVNVGGGDGFHVRVDPTDHTIVYSESQNGMLTRWNTATGERKAIRPRPLPGEPPYRFDWNSPLLLSVHNPRKLYFGGNRLFITEDRGETWRRTDDLTTRPDRDKLPIMGVVPGPGTLSRHDGQAAFGHIVSLAESPRVPGLLWAGTDDGCLHVSRDDGRTWTSVASRIPGAPAGAYFSRIVASHHADGRAYVAVDQHRSDDFRPYLFVTEDYGETWRPLAGGLPDGSCVNAVREHPRNEDLLFLGTERGLYVSLCRGVAWVLAGLPLPRVPVDDIQIHPRENDLILGTHGRGIWILDDITPLERLAEARTEGIHLFPPRRAVSWRMHSHKAATGHRIFLAPNPPSGALIQYYLGAKPPEGQLVKIQILSRDGRNVLREIVPESKEAGLHRVAWDFRLASPLPVEREGGRPGMGARSSGPRVMPGEHRVRLLVGDRQFTQPLLVEEDPRVRLSARDRKGYYGLTRRLGAWVRVAAEARRASQQLSEQLARLAASDPIKTAPAEARQDLAVLQRRTEEIQRLFTVPARRTAGEGSRADAGQPAPSPLDPPGRLAPPAILQLLFSVESLAEPPSRAVRSEADRIGRELEAAVRQLNALSRRDLARLNERIRAAGGAPVEPPAALVFER